MRITRSSSFSSILFILIILQFALPKKLLCIIVLSAVLHLYYLTERTLLSLLGSIIFHR